MNTNWPKITLDTTMEELQAIHKRIWDYVLENGCKPKTPYHANCVACEYCQAMCFRCPIIWPDGLTCREGESLYDRWCHCKDPESAQQIRDLPFKDS